MPEVRFTIRWPDGRRETCYSPSTIIAAYLAAGRSYTVADFVAACRAGLEAASERVRERYGVPCGRAMAQRAAIEDTAARLDPAGRVDVEDMI